MRQKNSFFGSKYLLLSKVFPFFVLAACIMDSQRPDSDEMRQLASQLLYVTSAVEYYDGDDLKEMSGRELVVKGTAHDPKLIAPFEKYEIKSKWADDNLILLVCDMNGKIGLIEDISCTSSDVDNALWQKVPPMPCEFTILNSMTCLP